MRASCLRGAHLVRRFRFEMRLKEKNAPIELWKQPFRAHCRLSMLRRRSFTAVGLGRRLGG